jgi:hypothetical protein
MLSFNWKSRKSRDSEAEVRHFMQAVRDSTEAQIDKWIDYYVRYGTMKDPGPEIVEQLRAYFNDIRKETGKPHEAARQLLRLQRIALRFGMMDWYALRGKGRDLGVLFEDASHSTNFVTATLTTTGGSEGDSEKLLRESDLESYLTVHEKIAELFPKPSAALLFLRDIKTNEDFETKVDSHCEDDAQSASLRTAWKVVALAKPDWWDADGSKVNVGHGSSLVIPYALHKMRLCFSLDESRPPEARIGAEFREHPLSKLLSFISCVSAQGA